jgi:tetratricopeptide (TPR) repeat protein
VVGVNPKHPGATHYLIHLYDSPAMAAEGLAFARAYDTIAPDAEHALHMPSHIYLQLGLWDEVVKSNERAWAASRAAQSPDWHAFSWLQYAYLQQGRFAAARGLIDTARALLGDTRGNYGDAGVLARLTFQYAAETGRWGETVSRPRLSSAEPASDRERHMRTFESYWLAVDAAQRGDTATILPGPPPFTRSLVPQVEALLAKARGDRAGYLRGLAASAEQERSLRAFSGPPERLMSLEILGAELLADGRVAESIKAYEDVLRLCPNRSRALLGLARAKSAAGDRAGAAELYGKLRANWARADVEVAASVPHF